MKPRDHYKGKEPTYLKHFFLERYLERVAYHVGSFATEFVYVDAFSGPWRSEDPDFSDSSPVIATSTLRRVRESLKKNLQRDLRVRCVFVEADRQALVDWRR